jgi:hypothetical protein
MKTPARFALLLLIALAGCARPAPIAPELAPDERDSAELRGRPGTGIASADLARAWFDLSYALVRQERLSPPVASRQWGYAGVALYEAVRAGAPGRPSLAGQLNGLANLPHANGAQDARVAANTALRAVFAGLHANASQGTRDQIEALYQARAMALLDQVPAGVYQKSERFGAALAEAVLAWADADGYAQFNNCAFTPPAGEGLWVPTPPAFAAALQPCWGSLRTCVVSNGAECDAGTPPPFSTQPGSAFHAEAFEVYDTVNHLTPEQMAIANYWADNPGQTGTPPGHWISIVGQIAAQQNLGLEVAAEAYAKVGLATMDAFICCWHTKYEINLLRPISYIRSHIDANWTTPIATPPFPEYTSGHSTQSAAVAVVLTDMFGELRFTDRTHESIGLPARTFDGFHAAANEAAISRLYGGIHYRAAIEKGLDQGRCIGAKVSALRWGNDRGRRNDRGGVLATFR